MAEFLNVHEKIKDLPAKQRQDFIWDRIIYANPIKADRDAASSSIPTSRWSPTTTTRR